jgi:hypothetical protein
VTVHDVFDQEAYLTVKHEFAEQCDASRCVFAKIDDQKLGDLFFDVNPPKLHAWLAKPSTQEIFKRHNFVPTRYTFNPLQMG